VKNGEHPSWLPFNKTLQGLRQASSAREFRSILARELSEVGVRQFALHVSPAGAPRPSADHIRVISSYDPIWLSRYEKDGLMSHDPVAQRALSSATPFDWASLQYRDGESVMREARQFDIKHGVSFPTLSSSGFGCLSVCFGRTPDRAASPADLALLNLMVPYLQVEVVRLLFRVGEISPRLTSRQREILSEIASGKRDREIGDKLGVTKQTVIAHMKSIRSKLEVHTRTGAVREAQRLGELTLLGEVPNYLRSN